MKYLQVEKKVTLKPEEHIMSDWIYLFGVFINHSIYTDIKYIGNATNAMHT